MEQAIRRALVSVSDKAGVEELGRRLAARGITILSTGGTAAALRDAGVAVTDVADHTGFPEIMGGRVKTLHPAIHGGILGRRGTDDAVMAAHRIEPIDLVVVNLYPFEATLRRSGIRPAEAIEQIDIGGPALVRAAAKNHDAVTVIVSPDDYGPVLDAIEKQGSVDAATRRRLAAEAFAHTAAYDAAIASFLAAGAEERLPATLVGRWHRAAPLRYGENPQQAAAVYREAGAAPDSVAAAIPLQGKALSYNNLADVDAALACVAEFAAPACVIVKHANPCGAAVAADLEAAYDGAFACDPTSAFGGIIAVNGRLDGALARRIVERQFVEVVAAPAVTDGALAALAERPHVRVLAARHRGTPAVRLRTIDGGLLAQEDDAGTVGADDLRVVSRRRPQPGELDELLFAWRVVKHVRSNAIVLSAGQRTVGIGAGQMSRVMSVRIASWKRAELTPPPEGPVAMASDAFFPFRDAVDVAAEAGVAAVIQPGGSRRDDEVIAAADEHGMLMVFTDRRHFRH